ncbi:hypothetical protein AHMF7605_03440 [Adhaeribacter arboris]|uniref:Tail fiber protein n=1 Tax=Adhaeribacter arboris TaxID=2072846 RepID=A0A2T2YAV2_9BACT|nr:hypothetical protein [Adhaeribacter arboris]PSR52645.1 hypothetical protein AHMF7605_03440 [Adhaeribacter arboris]
MKILYTTLLIFIFHLNVNAQFTVGSVQYSILNPESFTRLNPGWVLMERRSIRGSRLAAETGLDSLPDARGIFIRAMQAGRTDDNGEDIRSDARVNRAVGSYQKDKVIAHVHGTYGTEDSKAFEGTIHHNTTPKYITNVIRNKTEPTGDYETRPRNIALYLYIKIN